MVSIHLDGAKKHLHLSFTFFFFFLRKAFYVFRYGIMLFQWVSCNVYRTHKYFIQEKKNFKIGSHNTIHTFKNYFVTIFSIFSKINSIQTDLSTTLPSVFMGVITFKSVRMKIKIISSHLFFFQGSTRYKWNWSDNQLIVRLFVLFGIGV